MQEKEASHTLFKRNTELHALQSVRMCRDEVSWFVDVCVPPLAVFSSGRWKKAEEAGNYHRGELRVKKEATMYRELPSLRLALLFQSKPDDCSTFSETGDTLIVHYTV